MTKAESEQFKESLLIAKFLSGAWREVPPPLETSAEELEAAIIPLQNIYGKAFGWWRVKETNLCETNAAKDFHDAFRYYTIFTRAKEWQIEEAFSLLRSNNIEPILVKGWAINRLYPNLALRFFGDNDLLIQPRQFQKAQEILSSKDVPRLSVDVHKGTSNNTTKDLDIVPFEKLFERSQLVKLHESEIRILCNEDHLRLLTTHWLLDGAERATGLCDIALLVEKYSSDFNWEICLTENRKRARWIACTIELARQLLEADISNVPKDLRIKKIPRWLMPAVLKAWSEHLRFTPLSNDLKSPKTALKNLRLRWPPNPILSTVRLGGAFSEFPRLPYQIANYALRSFNFLKKNSV